MDLKEKIERTKKVEELLKNKATAHRKARYYTAYFIIYNNYIIIEFIEGRKRKKSILIYDIKNKRYYDYVYDYYININSVLKCLENFDIEKLMEILEKFGFSRKFHDIDIEQLLNSIKLASKEVYNKIKAFVDLYKL